MDIERKSLELKLDDQGVVEAVFSTFDVVDRDMDIVTREALKPFDGAEVPMVANHDWSIDGWLGKGRIVVGEKDARFVGQFLMDDPTVQSAFRKVKALQGLSQWSWAFRVKDYEWVNKDGQSVRKVNSLVERPYEVSPVLVGANQITGTVGIKELKAPWDTAYVNNLPDSAFAVVLPGGERDSEGKTTPRDLRKLPHHDEGGAVDDPHLRNALSREPQTDMPAEDHAKAKAHLERHAAAEGIGEDNQGKSLAIILVELDHLEEKAGATLSANNLGKLHSAMTSLMALHDASNCDMGADCPMYAGMKEAPSPEIHALARERELRDLESILGYRPLIAG